MDYVNSSRFSARAEELMKRYRAPGLAVGIVDGGNYTSKAFALAILIDDDEKYPDVQWEAIVSDLLPDEFVLPDEYYQKNLTIDDIVSHRTGLCSHDDSYYGPRAAEPDTPESVTRNLRNLPIGAPMRTKFMYNNVMYTVVTYLIEQKTGMSFADFLEEKIFAPLEMTSTHLQPERCRAHGLTERLARGHDWDRENSRYFGFDNPDAPEAQGAGAVITSVDDYTKFLAALLRCDGKPITKSMRRGMLKMRTLTVEHHSDVMPFCSPSIYAAGWEIIYYRGTRIVMHDGSMPGIGVEVCFMPEKDFGAILCVNASNSDTSTVLRYELYDEVLKTPQAERPDWPECMAGNIDSWMSKDDSDSEDDDEEGGEGEDENKEGEDESKEGEGKDESGGDGEQSEAAKRLEEDEDLRWSMRKDLCPGIGRDELRAPPQPLDAYAGEYWNAGYKSFTLTPWRADEHQVHGRNEWLPPQQLHGSLLHLDARDRSMGFTLTFEHVANGTEWIGHKADWLDGGNAPLEARFELGEDGRATRMGIVLEDIYIDGPYTWLDRVADGNGKKL